MNNLTLTDDSPMPFGKHKGKRMEEVPAAYLDWLRDQEWLPTAWPEVAAYIDENRRVIDWELAVGEMSDEA